jgi:hypothetical protein
MIFAALAFLTISSVLSLLKARQLCDRRHSSRPWVCLCSLDESAVASPIFLASVTQFSAMLIKRCASLMSCFGGSGGQFGAPTSEIWVWDKCVPNSDPSGMSLGQRFGSSGSALHRPWVTQKWPRVRFVYLRTSSHPRAEIKKVLDSLMAARTLRSYPPPGRARPDGEAQDLKSPSPSGGAPRRDDRPANAVRCAMLIRRGFWRSSA